MGGNQSGFNFLVRPGDDVSGHQTISAIISWSTHEKYLLFVLASTVGWNDSVDRLGYSQTCQLHELFQ